MSLAIPSFFQALCRKMLDLINIYFIGNLNDNAKLAGVGIGNMLANLVAMSAFIGFNMALDTLVS